MTRRAYVLSPAIVGLGLAVLAACQSRREPPPPADSASKSEPATKPAAPETKAADSRPASHAWQARGVRVELPVGWHEKKNPDYELYLVPDNVPPSASDEDARLTFDVPDLPPHLPWMIQMSRVAHDYEADLKKSHPDLKVQEATEVKMPETIARLVRSNWHTNGVRYEDTALLMIHASGVYILDGRADEKHFEHVKSAFENMRSSIQWK